MARSRRDQSNGRRSRASGAESDAILAIEPERSFTIAPQESDAQ